MASFTVYPKRLVPPKKSEYPDRPPTMLDKRRKAAQQFLQQVGNRMWTIGKEFSE